MVHDMLLGSEHMVFVVPPVQFDLSSLLSGHVAPADAMHYMYDEPTRMIVIRKDGKGTPITSELPACMVFHHGNLAEAGDVLTLDSMISPDDSILRFVAARSTNHPVQPQCAQLTCISLDLNKK